MFSSIEEHAAKLKSVGYLVADGKLHILPFDALKDAKGKCILKSHVVTYAPSVTVLDLLQKARSSNPAEMNFLGAGGVSMILTQRFASHNAIGF